MNSINSLPQEIHLIIQTYLDRTSAASYFLVCRSYFESLSNNDLAWKLIFPEIAYPAKIKAKTHLDLQKVTSMDGILRRIELFANMLLIGQRGAFDCVFPFIPQSYLKISLKMDLVVKPNRALIRNRKLPIASPSLSYIFMKRTFAPGNRLEEKHAKEPYISDGKLAVVLYARHQIDICLPHELMIYAKIIKIIQKVLEEKTKKLNSSIKLKPLKRLTL